MASTSNIWTRIEAMNRLAQGARLCAGRGGTSRSTPDGRGMLYFREPLVQCWLLPRRRFMGNLNDSQIAGRILSKLVPSAPRFMRVSLHIKTF